MFDHVAPTVFWPLVVLAWLAGSMVVAWLFAKFVDGRNPRRNRYINADEVAERKRVLDRNGFKSRMGAR
jgi:membrane protein implicated in regulation of membrane protease activity